MKTRLMWLFLLCCGLLLMFSLMVVAEGEPRATLPQDCGPAVAVAFKPQAAPEPAEQQADPQAAHVLPMEQRVRRAAKPAEAPAQAYRQVAYHAFHPSDEAG